MQKITATLPLAAGCPTVLEAAGIAFEIAPDGLYASDAVHAGIIVDGYAGSAAELAYHKREAILALGLQYDTRIAAGRVYSVSGGLDPSPHVYQIDEVPPFDPQTNRPTRRDSQSTMSTMAIWAGNVIKELPGVAAWPAGFVWRDAGNGLVPMTAVQCYAFAQDAGVYVADIFGNYVFLARQIEAAADVAAVAAIDITAGWPSNP